MIKSARFLFRPSSVDIAAGGAVTFVWAGGDPHNVVSTGSPTFADHPAIQTGGSFLATFAQPGTYSFICEVHPDTMRGKVIVH